ncbi:MAG: aspartate/glutamate racemase family protein [Conexivisphaerales archaeon]
MKVVGGRHHYGQAIGILTLDTRFPRIVGDVGNATTYDFPVRFRYIRGASIPRVVKEKDPKLLKPFVEAARELEKDGVRAITTSCGFLSIFQDELASAVEIPVFTSALMLVPLVHRMLGPKEKVGIITADSSSLSNAHLVAAGIDPKTVVVEGLQFEPEFSKIYNNELEFDPKKVEAEVLRAATRIRNKNDQVKAIVFECANLPPYAEAVHKSLGLPVFDIVTLAKLVYNGVVIDQRFTRGFM